MMDILNLSYCWSNLQIHLVDVVRMFNVHSRWMFAFCIMCLYMSRELYKEMQLINVL
jgi:hypothetical protein